MYDVPQEEFVQALSEELKGKVKMPEWAIFVKTGNHKERPPANDNWWQMRAASILRQVYLKGPVGVSKLRFKYGGRKNRGMKPERFVKGSGKIIRTILQQLENAKLVEQGQKGVHKGRVVTTAGESMIFTVAKKMGSQAKPEKKADSTKQDKPQKKAEEKGKKEEKKEQKPAKEEKKASKQDGKDVGKKTDDKNNNQK